MKNAIRILRLQKGWTQKDLMGRLKGWSQPDVSRAELGVTPLGEEEIRQLSEVFDVGVGEILGESEKKIKNQEESRLPTATEGSMSPVSFGPDMVPILGSANGSSEALILNFDEPIGEIMRHPNQKGMKGSFAVLMRGESMYPRYKEADPIFAIYNRPPSRGQDCLIELTNGESFVKCFIKKTAKDLICEQYNPASEWKRKLADVKAMHAVVGRG